MKHDDVCSGMSPKEKDMMKSKGLGSECLLLFALV